MKRTPEQCVPPGVDAKGEFGTLWTLWSLFGVETLWRCFVPFFQELEHLKEWNNPIEPFFRYFSGTWWFVPMLMVLPLFGYITLIWLAVKAVSHYRYYRSGSRADYTMKRLPDRREYHRRALAMPVFGLIGTVLLYLLLLGIGIAVYYLATPSWMEPKLFYDYLFV